MSDYTILKLEAGQTIPRPFGMACSHEELAEMIAHHVTYRLRGREAAKQEAAKSANWLGTQHIDTETPVCEIGTTKFYVFGD